VRGSPQLFQTTLSTGYMYSGGATGCVRSNDLTEKLTPWLSAWLSEWDGSGCRSVLTCLSLIVSDLQRPACLDGLAPSLYMDRQFCEVWTCVLGYTNRQTETHKLTYIHTDRQTDRHTNCNASHPYKAGIFQDFEVRTWGCEPTIGGSPRFPSLLSLTIGVWSQN